MTQIERVPYRLEFPESVGGGKFELEFSSKSNLFSGPGLLAEWSFPALAISPLSWPLRDREANAALPTPAELIAKKLRLDSPSAPGLLSYCSLDRLSRSVPALISCGLLMRVFPVTHTRLCSTDESTRRANLDFHKIFGSPRGQEQCWH